MTVSSANIAGKTPLPPTDLKLINLMSAFSYSVSPSKSPHSGFFISSDKIGSIRLYSQTIAGYDENGSLSALPVSISAVHSTLSPPTDALRVAVWLSGAFFFVRREIIRMIK